MSETSTAAFCCCDNSIFFSVALTAGSNFGAEAASCGDRAAKGLKFGKETRSKFGKETRLKSGKEKRSKSGKELAVAAPMTAKAAKDTAIASTRFEAPSSAASGWLPPMSDVSATCVPYVSIQSQDFSSPPISTTRRSRHVGDPATIPPGDCPPK